MQELRRVVASGVLGRIMHIEGHYSNENSESSSRRGAINASETPVPA